MESTDRSPQDTSMNESPARLPIDVPGFSGPLDLLVHLIAKHEMDIFAISISTITDEYLKIIRELEKKDLDLVGEYLVLSATLVRYKSRALLPKDETEPEEEEINDQILEERRREYERFRQLAERLRIREEESAALFPRMGSSPEGKPQVVEYTEVNVYDLYRSFQKILEEIGSGRVPAVEGDTYSVDEKMLEIEALVAHNQRVSLMSYLQTLSEKLEAIVVFLALLELIRLREIRAFQTVQHDEIFLEKGDRFPSHNDEETDV